MGNWGRIEAQRESARKELLEALGPCCLPPPGYHWLMGANENANSKKAVASQRKTWKSKLQRKPCVVHLPAELKMFREPHGNQIPREVPSMIRQPQSWKPKDPKENNTNNVKTKRVEQTLSSPSTGPKRKQKPLTTQFPEKILDVLKLSPGHKGKNSTQGWTP